jgi:hypothetical protein
MCGGAGRCIWCWGKAETPPCGVGSSAWRDESGCPSQRLLGKLFLDRTLVRHFLCLHLNGGRPSFPWRSTGT